MAESNTTQIPFMVSSTPYVTNSTRSDQVVTKLLAIGYLTALILVSTAFNSIVCAALYRGRLLAGSAYITNHFILSLSLSDLLNSVLKMPTSLLGLIDANWHPNTGQCYVTAPLGVLFGSASVFSLCAVAVNRYYVITRSFNCGQNPFHFVHARIIIVLIWLGSVALSVPPTFWRKPEVICRSGAVSSENYTSELLYFIALWLFVIVLPGLIMFVVYYQTFKVVRDHVYRMSIHGQTALNKLAQNRFRKNKEIRLAVILAILGGLFILCWHPFFVFQTFLKFGKMDISRKSFYFFLCLMYTNSALNPLFMITFNKNVRKACKKLLNGR